MRWGVGAGVRALQARGCARVLVDADAAPDAAAEAAHLSAWRYACTMNLYTISKHTFMKKVSSKDHMSKMFGTTFVLFIPKKIITVIILFRFQEFKSSEDRQTVASVEMYECEQGGGEGGGEALWARGAVMGAAQNWARYLSDMPANKMTPTGVAQAALDALCPLGVRVWARDAQWAAAQRMAAFLAVARGSCEPPCLLDLAYAGAAPDTPPVLLAAKGVTFDSLVSPCLYPDTSH